MSLDLDARQRAMLAEMGVHVWWPQTPALATLDAADLQADSDHHAAAENIAISPEDTRARGQNDAQSVVPIPVSPVHVAATPTQVATEQEAPPERTADNAAPAAASLRAPATVPRRVITPGPTTLQPLPEGIGQMDWPALGRAINACQACKLCLGRQAPVFNGVGADCRADWMVVGEPPDITQERAGLAFIGDEGKLLDNMLRAVGLKRLAPGAAAGESDPARSAYITQVVKCSPALPTPPDAQAFANCAHYLRREIALVQPKVIITMGRAAMQLLLSEDHPEGLKLPLGKLRGRTWHFQGVPVVVSYPPRYLLSNLQDKARAWEDLCLAADVAEGVDRAS